MASMKVEDLPALLGTEIGVSKWHHINQQRIDQFAACTEDHQFIHVDPEAAAKTPFGGTIAHGFLTLSLIPIMAKEINVPLEGAVMAMNYGLDKVRFLQPVPVGSDIRGTFVLASAEEKRPGQWLTTYEVTAEVKGQDKPAFIAKTLVLHYLG
ncbi:MAG: MaoC family dehydratase [Pseudomonadota bacterium]